MTLPAVQIMPDLAPKLREIVCSAERGLLPLSILTDEQILVAAKGISRNWPIERIAQQLYTYKLKSEGITWSQLQGLMPEFKRQILSLISGDKVSDERPEMLDPLAENAALIRDLRTEYDYWTKQTRDGIPTKDTFDHVARLGRLLLEATANHATIRNKLGLGSPSASSHGNKGNQDIRQTDEASPVRSEFSAENMQFVFTGLSGEGMSDFMESARLKMEAVAKPKVLTPEEMEQAQQKQKQPKRLKRPTRTKADANKPKRRPGRPKNET